MCGGKMQGTKRNTHAPTPSTNKLTHICTNTHLLFVAARRKVRHSPSRFFARLELPSAQGLQDRADQARLNHRLDLRLRARRDVRQCPGR
jgi:hypothetical protein